MTQALYEEGIAYAEENFRNENANHLKVDKELLRRRFNLTGKKILDFGCGMGGMSLWYATTWNCEVHGVDIDRHHIRIANDLKNKYRVDNVSFEVRDILEKPLQEKYDLIVLNDVAEHIPLPVLEKIFCQLANSLFYGGGIFVSYPPWKSPYASHVSHVVGILWCQFLPQGWLIRRIEKNNRPIVGEEESDLVAAYKGLNRLTHRKLMRVVRAAGLKLVYRKSHCLFNRLPLLKNLNLRFFPFDFLITKEFLLLEKPNGIN